VIVKKIVEPKKDCNHSWIFDRGGALGSAIYKCFCCDGEKAVLPDGPGSAVWRSILGKQNIEPA
jgi:hypothetical protein